MNDDKINYYASIVLADLQGNQIADFNNVRAAMKQLLAERDKEIVEMIRDEANLSAANGHENDKTLLRYIANKIEESSDEIHI
jgi:hypothetical protein